MNRVRFDISMSLDGYVTASGVSAEMVGASIAGRRTHHRQLIAI